MTAVVAATSAILVDSYRSTKNGAAAIQSTAVLPFVNESGNADFEYLSDGMTETLINSLSQQQVLTWQSRPMTRELRLNSTTQTLADGDQLLLSNFMSCLEFKSRL